MHTNPESKHRVPLYRLKEPAGTADNQKMKIQINGTPLDFTLENEKTVGEVMAQLERACEANGMTITAVRAGGKTLSADTLDNLFAVPVTDAEDLELETISGREILALAEEKSAACAALADQLEEVPVLLQTGREKEAMAVMETFSRETEELKRLLPLLSLGSVAEENLLLDGQNPGEYLAAVFPFIGEMSGAIEQQDTVTIGDIAEYEIAPRMREIGNFLTAVVRNAGQNP